MVISGVTAHTACVHALESGGQATEIRPGYRNELPDVYSCSRQPRGVSGAAVLLAAVRFILYSGIYKVRLKSVALPRNPSFRTFR